MASGQADFSRLTWPSRIGAATRLWPSRIIRANHPAFAGQVTGEFHPGYGGRSKRCSLRISGCNSSPPPASNPVSDPAASWIRVLSATALVLPVRTSARIPRTAHSTPDSSSFVTVFLLISPDRRSRFQDGSQENLVLWR